MTTSRSLALCVLLACLALQCTEFQSGRHSSSDQARADAHAASVRRAQRRRAAREADPLAVQQETTLTDAESVEEAEDPLLALSAELTRQLPTINGSAPQTRVLFEPAGPGILHFAGTMGKQTDALDDYIEGVGKELAPAGKAIFVAMQGTRGWKGEMDRVIAELRDAKERGGMLNIGLNFGFSQTRFGTGVDKAYAETTEFDERADDFAGILHRSGVPILLRIGTEVNGAWGGHHPYIFPKAFRKMVTRFRELGVDNVAFVWCIAPHGDPDIFEVDADGDARWYPGDQYIDWYGLDVFDRLHFSSWGVYGRADSDHFFQVSSELMRMARRAGKPVLIGETTPKGMDIPSHREDRDGVRADLIWKEWFLPFLAFLDMHREVKGVTLLPLDWRKTTAWPEWGDARLQRNPELLRRWRDELRRSRWWHLSSVPRAVDMTGSTPPPPMLEPSDYGDHHLDGALPAPKPAPKEGEEGEKGEGKGEGRGGKGEGKVGPSRPGTDIDGANPSYGDGGQNPSYGSGGDDEDSDGGP